MAAPTRDSSSRPRQASDKERRQAYNSEFLLQFRTKLLEQREFEKDKKEDKERDKMLAAISTAERRRKSKPKRWSLKYGRPTSASLESCLSGRFLSERIIHKCIYRLLRLGSDEESLECLRQAITTTAMEFGDEQTWNYQRTPKWKVQLRVDERNWLTIATLRK